MRDGDRYMVIKGRGKREAVFCFYVDRDRSCWTTCNLFDARRFETPGEAEDAVKELRKRDQIRRGRIANKE